MANGNRSHRNSSQNPSHTWSAAPEAAVAALARAVGSGTDEAVELAASWIAVEAAEPLAPPTPPAAVDVDIFRLKHEGEKIVLLPRKFGIVTSSRPGVLVILLFLLLLLLVRFLLGL